MVWQNSVFPLLIIPAGVPGTGLYVYNGVPGPGNPPIVYIASGGVTHDPYGNALPTAGGGVVSNNPGVEFAELANGGVAFGLTGATPSAITAAIQIALAGAGQSLQFGSGTVGADTGSLMLLGDSAVNTGGYIPGLNINDGSDGVIYHAGEKVQFNTAAVPIPASGFTPVFSQAVAANGSYRFDGKMRLKQGAIGSIPGNIGFTGPATSFGLYDVFWSLQGAGNTFNSVPTTSFGTQVNVLGAQTVAGNEVVAWYRGIVTFTAAGTLTIGCQADGTHPFTAQPGCEFSVRRVS